MVCFNWVGHSGVTSFQFGPVVCSALWLLTYRMNGSVLRLTDTINLGVTTALIITTAIKTFSYFKEKQSILYLTNSKKAKKKFVKTPREISKGRLKVD